MRITVNLSQFFHDHRLEAKIFIKENMKCIKDLEDHLSNIFQIDNFYLKCEGHYLPSLEDVHLLCKDDVIWVTPISVNSSSREQTFISLENSVQTEEVHTIKKMRKRGFEELSADNPQLLMKTNKSRCRSESNNDSICDVPEEVRNLNIREEIDEDKGCEDESLKNKRINIIKTVIVADENGTLGPSLTDCFSIANLNVSAQKEMSSLAANAQGIATSKNNVSTANFQTALDNSNLKIGGKKRRRRARNKNRLNKGPEPSDTLAISIYDLMPRPLLLTKGNDTHNAELENNSKDNKETVVTIMDDDSDCAEEAQASEGLVNNESKNKQLTEGLILKQPIVQNIQPKCGDLIGFKVHSVSNSNASKISSMVVGKVVASNPENSEVTLDIIYGQDECFQSQESCPLEDKRSNSTQFHCKWSDLLDPRLLP